MPIYKGGDEVSAIKFGEQDVVRVYQGASVIWEADNGPAVPALSQPFHLWVARDIDLDSGTWPSRTDGVTPPLVLNAFGTPVISTAFSWASGIPVLDGDTGCFFADWTPLAADAGLSMAYIAGAVSGPFYIGPPVFGNALQNAYRVQRFNSTSIRATVGNGGLGAERATSFEDGTTFLNGELYQFDRPVGTALPIGNWSGFREGNALNKVIVGSTPSISSGSRVVLGGLADTLGGITIAPTTELLAAFVCIGGTPLSAPDRAALTSFMQGIRAGTIL